MYFPDLIWLTSTLTFDFWPLAFDIWPLTFDLWPWLDLEVRIHPRLAFLVNDCPPPLSRRGGGWECTEKVSRGCIRIYYFPTFAQSPTQAHLTIVLKRNSNFSQFAKIGLTIKDSIEEKEFFTSTEKLSRFFRLKWKGGRKISNEFV